jgi:hypothetical protein
MGMESPADSFRVILCRIMEYKPTTITFSVAIMRLLTPQYYRNTVIQDTKAPDHRNVDILELVLPSAKKRGVKVFTWSEDVLESCRTQRRKNPGEGPIRQERQNLLL